ncbi:MAG: hypothetical protein SOY67_02695 [Collinsella sp.]|nr:hypothetical protein [Collinsella sp.]
MSRQTAKGTRFESAVAAYLAELDPRIERRVKHGTKDRGDIGGVLLHGRRVVVECKDRRRMELSAWLSEAETERGNDDADHAVVVHHRAGRGTRSMGDQYVTMTLATFRDMLAGGRGLIGG